MSIFRNLLRRKNLHSDHRSTLSRCLNALDLTALGKQSVLKFHSRFSTNFFVFSSSSEKIRVLLFLINLQSQY